MKKNFLIVLLIVSFSLAFYSCKDNSTEPEPDSSTLTISHFGVDWSEGKVGSDGNFLDYNNVDGETINWCEYSSSDNMYGKLVAYRPTSNKMYKVSEADLSKVTSIDENLWNVGVDCGTAKLVPGDIWAAKCNDGFVVFKVLECSTEEAAIMADHENKVKVEYKFSTSTKF